MSAAAVAGSSSKVLPDTGVEKPVNHPLEPPLRRNSKYYTSDPLDLEFTSVCVEIAGKKILHGISGSCKSGEVLAVMGPTGAGKTTLLTCLSHRMSYTGRVTYGNETWTRKLKKEIGFVEQEDIVLPALTVQQSLDYSAALRLPGSMSEEDKKNRVAEVIGMLRLNKCAGTKIGTVDDRGVSGGERKRLCIATELLANPAVIFFDEPTSGLDSSMALVVAKCMKDIAEKEELTVVTTIHQPNSQVFAQFDSLLLLDEGFTAYSGTCNGVVNYFSKLGHPCPEHFNPPDFLMDLIVNGVFTEEEKMKMRADFMPPLTDQQDVKVKAIEEAETYPISYAEQIRILTSRFYIVLLDGFFDFSIVVLNAGLAVIAGLLWVQLGWTEGDIYPRVGLSLWIIGTWTFFPMLNGLPVFADKTMLIKELRVGAYPLSAYYIARTVTTLPLEFIWPWFYVTIVFWITNVNPSFVVYLTVFGAVMLNIFAMQACSLAISAAVPARHQITVTLLIITYFWAYSGLFMPLTRLPEWLQWVEHPNLLRHSYYLLMRIVFTDDHTYSCTTEGLSNYDKCLADPSYRINYQDVLEYAGVTPEQTATRSVLVALGFLVVFRIVAFVFLQRAVRQTE